MNQYSFNTQVLFRRGLLYHALGKLESTLEDYDLVITFEPDNTVTYLNRALVKVYMGKYKEAMEDTEKVAKIELYWEKCQEILAMIMEEGAGEEWKN